MIYVRKTTITAKSGKQTVRRDRVAFAEWVMPRTYTEVEPDGTEKKVEYLLPLGSSMVEVPMDGGAHAPA